MNTNTFWGFLVVIIAYAYAPKPYSDYEAPYIVGVRKLLLDPASASASSWPADAADSAGLGLTCGS